MEKEKQNHTKRITMIKTIVFFTFIFVMFCSIQAQNVETEIIKEQGLIIQKTKYRRDGRIAERNVMIGDNSWYEELNTYEDTFLTASSHYLKGLKLADYKYFYNDQNLLEKRIEMVNDSIGVITFFTYNEDGQLISEEILSNDKLQLTITYEYDKDGKMTARTEALTDNEIAVYNNEYFEYNEKGLLVKRTQMSGVDTLVCHTYSYDNLNRCKEVIVQSGGEVISRIEWSFVKDTDKIKKETHFSNGYIVRMEKLKYNSRGLLKKNIVIDYRVFENIPGQKKVIYRHIYTYYD